MPRSGHRDRGQAAVRAGLQPIRGDWRRATHRSSFPRCGHKLLACTDKVLCAGANALRPAHEHMSFLRHDLGEHLHRMLTNQWNQRFHALHPLAIADAGEHFLDLARARGGEFLRGGLHVVVDKQCTTREDIQLVDLYLRDRALVSDGKGAQVGDLVTPELDTYRQLFGRRENIDDAATHGKLATPADHVHMRIAVMHQPLNQVLAVPVQLDVNGGAGFRLKVVHNRLHQRAHRRNQNVDFAPANVVKRLTTLRHGIHRWRKLLMRERLPRGEHSYTVADHRLDLGSQVLRLTAGSRDDQHRHLRRHGVNKVRTHRVRTRERQLVFADAPEHADKLRIRDNEAFQPRQRVRQNAGCGFRRGRRRSWHSPNITMHPGSTLRAG